MLKRVLSGTRPTGKAHLGNLAGAFFNWVKLQEEHQCFFFVADWHVLTTHWREPRLRENTLEMVKDWLAVGLDPERSTLFMQSAIPEHAELALLFGMLVSLQRALRVPSFKEHLEDISTRTLKQSVKKMTPVKRVANEIVSQVIFETRERMVNLRRRFQDELRERLDDVFAQLEEKLRSMEHIPKKHGPEVPFDDLFVVLFEAFQRALDKSEELLTKELQSLLRGITSILLNELSGVLSQVITEAVVDTPGFERVSYGFLGYPILQAADIAIYRAHLVPVGEDQVPHIELTREIVRRFNSTYGQVFPEPEPILTPTPRILGIDGRKMSKRYDNGIYIADSPEEVRKKVMAYYTDPQRVRKTDPGHPERCPLFTLIKAFLPQEAEERAEACRKGQIGCVECKRRTAEGLLKFLEPLRERREKISDEQVAEILREGTERARKEAQETMALVRKAIGTAWIYS